MTGCQPADPPAAEPETHGDLRELTAVAFVQRAAVSTRLEPGTVLSFLAAGVHDVDLIDSAVGERASRGVRLLTEDGGVRVEPPLDEHDLGLLPLVGAEAYRRDRDNVEDWAGVARLFDEGREASYSEDYSLRMTQPRTIVTAFLRAGRGPTYARRVVACAVRHGVDPRAYGFDVTAGEWESLADAGVEDLASLDGYRSAGCSLATAVRLSSEHIAPGVAVIAAADAVPQEQWIRWAGVPAEWVPLSNGDSMVQGRTLDPRKDGPLGQGHQLDDLKAYVDAGWSVSNYQWRNGVRAGQGRRSQNIALTPSTCRQLLESQMTPLEFARLADAITQSSAGAPRDVGYVPSLSGHHRWQDDLLTGLLALHRAGVRSSHVNDYRYAGCTSIEQTLRAIEQGIDASRVKQLRNAFGRSGRWGRSPRLSYGELLRYHTDEAGQPPTPE